MRKAIDHLAHPIFALPVGTEDTRVHNAEVLGEGEKIFPFKHFFKLAQKD